MPEERQDVQAAGVEVRGPRRHFGDARPWVRLDGSRAGSRAINFIAANAAAYRKSKGVGSRQVLDAKMAKTPAGRDKDPFWRGCADAVKSQGANPEIGEMQVDHLPACLPAHRAYLPHLPTVAACPPTVAACRTCRACLPTVPACRACPPTHCAHLPHLPACLRAHPPAVPRPSAPRLIPPRPLTPRLFTPRPTTNRRRMASTTAASIRRFRRADAALRWNPTPAQSSSRR